jgi:CheY-like chemotaxis protein
MTRVIIVEDDDRISQQVRGWVQSAMPDAETVVCKSLASSLAALETGAAIDLAICDLRIPANDESPDPREEHGLRVHEEIKVRLPGVPQFFYTAHAAEVDTREQLSRGGTADLFGTHGAEPLVTLIRKDEPDRCQNYIQAFAGQLAELEKIEVDSPGDSSALSTHEARAIRIFARRQSGIRVVVDPLQSLSGAKPFRARVIGVNGNTRALAFGKVASRSEILDEENRYTNRVAVCLSAGSFAPLADRVVHCAGEVGGLFYSLADQDCISMFEVVDSDIDAGVMAIHSLEEVTGQWRENIRSSKVSLGELRSERLGPEALAGYIEELGDVQVERIDQLQIDIRQCLQHGDLHGANVLIDSSGRVLLIDFADVGVGPTCLDPVVLELSFLFHSSRPNRVTGWPNEAAAARWWELEDFIAGSPIAPVIRACRAWSMRVATPLEVASVGYLDAVRQLKYRDTDKSVACAVARSAAQAILELSG